jgi:hypothetical protein
VALHDGLYGLFADGTDTLFSVHAPRVGRAALAWAVKRHTGGAPHTVGGCAGPAGVCGGVGGRAPVATPPVAA